MFLTVSFWLHRQSVMWKVSSGSYITITMGFSPGVGENFLICAFKVFYFPLITVTLSCQIMDHLQEVVFLWQNEPVKQFSEAKWNKNSAFFHCFPSLALWTFFCFEIPLELMVVSTGTTPTTTLPSCLTSGTYQDWNSRLTLENPSCHSSNCWRSCPLPARSCCLLLTG